MRSYGFGFIGAAAALALGGVSLVPADRAANVPKVADAPTRSPLDNERMGKAEAKRQRKAAKRAALKARGLK